MSGIGGFVIGVIGLSALEAVVSSSQATGRVGGAFTSAATVLQHLASPDVPLIPDLRTTSKAGTGPVGGASTSTGTGNTASPVSSTSTILTNRFPATRKA